MHKMLVLVLLVGCGGGSEGQNTETLAAEKCPKVHLDRLAGDWVMVQGATADGKTRLRIVQQGDTWKGFYVVRSTHGLADNFPQSGLRLGRVSGEFVAVAARRGLEFSEVAAPGRTKFTLTRIDREPIVGVSDFREWQNVALVQQYRQPVFAAGLAALSQALAPVFP